MLTRTKVFGLTVAALLLLTLAPGMPITATPGTQTVRTQTGSLEARDPPILPIRRSPTHPLFSTAGAENVEFVGHIGGYTNAVAVQGDYAYIGVGPRLTILDISDPASPAVAGKTLPLPDIVQGVAVAGGYAYVAAEGSGLRVVDVSTPSNPTEVGFYDTPGYAQGVAVAGGYAYVADWDDGLIILRYTGVEDCTVYLPLILGNYP